MKGIWPMRAVVIGGSGHIGTYLVPRLVEAGYDVIVISRGQRDPYTPHRAWQKVTQQVVDRDAEDAAGVFGQRIRDLKPDVVIDLICFTLESARQLTEALKGQVQHFLHCGTIWTHGHSVSVPTTEDQRKQPFGDYGIQKAAIETYLLDQSRRYAFPATLLHPGHIVGEGWAPLNPAGHFNLEVFARLAGGEELALPNLGLETVHHVHADDVAQSFMQAMFNRSSAIGEGFHVVSPAAITLRGYAESMSAWFGQPSRLRFLGWEDWRKTVAESDANATWDHIAHSPNASIAKAQRMIGYQPRYTSLQAVQESVQWLIKSGKIAVPQNAIIEA
jgi:nucleoside-diphosphate-sugar epimerase